jgi:hypothetical protein
MSQTSKIVLTILITAIVVGGGVFLYTKMKQREPFIQQSKPITETVTESETKRVTDSGTMQKSVEEKAKISFVSCADSLYSDNRAQYNFWQAKFSELYPDLRVYDAGAYCELNNGNQLISFSYVPVDGEIPEEVGQTIILFDKNNDVLKATENFHCLTLGDIGYPKFKSLEKNKVTMTCSSGDAGNFLELTYELDLDTFEFSLTSRYESYPRYN